MQTAIELFQIVNLTSMIDVLAAKDAAKGAIEVIEYDQRSLVVQIPRARLRLGHLVEFSGQMRFGGKAHRFKSTGKILRLVESETDAGPTVTIHLNQFDKDLWDRFIQTASGDQVRVDGLLASMKDDGG